MDHLKTLFRLIFLATFSMACSKETPTPIKEAVYDETGCLYTSYNGLVMAGYQGWFSAEGDIGNRGWYKYGKWRNSWFFEPGISEIDLWPDIAEYPNTYNTAFKYEDGSMAKVFSSIDASTVNLHFKWMKDYGIDGVFLQRFIWEMDNERSCYHNNTVFKNALEASKQYCRAFCVMYDLSLSEPSDFELMIKDWENLQSTFSLFDNIKNPTYLRHNKKPLVAIWGVGFNDNRKYSLQDVYNLIKRLKGSDNKVSIMLGVPYHWRTLSGDTENNTLLHQIIKEVDIIMPWSVGRYNNVSFSNEMIANDLIWCNDNSVDYAPCIFPGFSWGNLMDDHTIYNWIPRNKGDFFWKQVDGAKTAGAKSLYIAMFDEINEGTAIFKCQPQNKLPLNGSGKFIGIEDGLATDYYLWLTGQATNWFHGIENYSNTKPIR